MSHVTTIDMKDEYTLGALKLMCINQKWGWREGQKTYRWFGKHIGDHPIPDGFTVQEMGRCDHAISIPGCDYEIGVVQKNGKWRLLWDFWQSGGLQEVLGETAGKLKQAYAMANVQLTCQQKNVAWTKESLRDKRPGWQKMVVKVGAGGGVGHGTSNPFQSKW